MLHEALGAYEAKDLFLSLGPCISVADRFLEREAKRGRTAPEYFEQYSSFRRNIPIYSLGLLTLSSWGFPIKHVSSFSKFSISTKFIDILRVKLLRGS